MIAFLALGLTAACASGDDDSNPPGTDGSNGQADSNTAACSGGCVSPDMCCDVGGDSFCINVSADPNNCGGCGITCDPVTGDDCSGSQCKCGFAPACTGGAECCDTGCKNLQSDPTNCGMCGNNCGMSSSCNAGMCVCAATGGPCGAGTSCCSTGCVDTSADNNNCGMCGNVCGPGTSCSGGQCLCGGVSMCTPMQACCGTTCADICADMSNCGSCGNVCDSAAGEVCFFGGCFPGELPNPACM